MAFCPSCGAVLPPAPVAFCPSCGAPQQIHPPAAAPYTALEGDGIRRSFAASVGICLNKYATFKGRAPRAEFWFFTLFNILVGFIAGLIDGFIRVAGHAPDWHVFDSIASLVFLLPSIAVQVRRLHDTGRSGWWWLLSLIPLIGWLILLIWDCTPGATGPNQYGPENGIPIRRFAPPDIGRPQARPF